jgi:hypothetical protein
LDAALGQGPEDGLRAEAERLKQEGALGRSTTLLRLFDYLLERTLTGRSPKEVEVAMDVFGRPADFEPGRDAVARVYAHKLRQRLQASYAARTDHAGPRIVVPRGEYRLLLEAPTAEAADETPAPPGRLARLRRWVPAVAAGLAVAFASSVVTVAALRLTTPAGERELEAVRASPLWRPLLRTRRPTVIVLGDYYIFGESSDGMGVDRLVREYAINSREDLSEYLMNHPEKEDHYLDLDLRYLPIGAGAALRRLAPVLAGVAAHADDVRVVLMSGLTPAMLRNDNVVYVGYLSGMGWLRDVALGGSRFAVGETFDDLIDRRTRARYASQGGPSDEGRGLYRDYGYVSTFAGPDGGRVVVIAGTRDAGLMQAAEEATRPDAIRQADGAAGGARDREALYETTSLYRLNVRGRLLAASKLEAKEPAAGD